MTVVVVSGVRCEPLVYLLDMVPLNCVRQIGDYSESTGLKQHGKRIDLNPLPRSVPVI